MRYIEAEKLKKKLETLRVDPDVKSMVWSGDVEAIIDEIPEAEPHGGKPRCVYSG